MLAAFEGHNVVAVLQGHLHVNEVVVLKNTQYILSGAVCGNWWRGVRMGFPEGFTVVSARDGQDHHPLRNLRVSKPSLRRKSHAILEDDFARPASARLRSVLSTVANNSIRPFANQLRRRSRRRVTFNVVSATRPTGAQAGPSYATAS